MGILSRLWGRRDVASSAEETSSAPPEAVQRALRIRGNATGSLPAAELGQHIATALSTIETAVLAMDAIAERLREAADLVRDAASSEDHGRRALLAGRYDDLRAEIDAIAGSASHNRVNLIAGRRIGGTLATFDIPIDGDGRSGIAIQVANLTTGEAGLSLSPPHNAFADDAEIETIAAELEKARERTFTISERFADHAALISERLARLRELAGSHAIETRLPTGADDDAPPPRTEYELGMDAVEDKLRALAERLESRSPKIEAEAEAKSLD